MCMSNLCLSTPLHSVFCVLLYVLACYVSEPATAAAEGKAIGAGEQEAKACQSWRVCVRRVCPLTTCILPFHERRGVPVGAAGAGSIEESRKGTPELGLGCSWEISHPEKHETSPLLQFLSKLLKKVAKESC